MPKVRLLQVKVKPNARASALDEVAGVWQARLKSPPVEGRANAELVALIAARFGCPKAAVTIKSGRSSRLKLVRIEE
jgi:uncharacterized protein (TIGR00251 family)